MGDLAIISPSGWSLFWRRKADVRDRPSSVVI
jgi:hypothetical protein